MALNMCRRLPRHAGGSDLAQVGTVKRCPRALAAARARVAAARRAAAIIKMSPSSAYCHRIHSPGFRPPLLTRGSSLGANVSRRNLRPASPAAESPVVPTVAGSALSRKKETIRSSLNRSEIARSWRLLIAGLVSQA